MANYLVLHVHVKGLRITPFNRKFYISMNLSQERGSVDESAAKERNLH